MISLTGPLLSIYPTLKAPILIGSDSLTSKESEAKTVCINILYVE